MPHHKLVMLQLMICSLAWRLAIGEYPNYHIYSYKTKNRLFREGYNFRKCEWDLWGQERARHLVQLCLQWQILEDHLTSAVCPDLDRLEYDRFWSLGKLGEGNSHSVCSVLACNIFVFALCSVFTFSASLISSDSYSV